MRNQKREDARLRRSHSSSLMKRGGNQGTRTFDFSSPAGDASSDEGVVRQNSSRAWDEHDEVLDLLLGGDCGGPRLVEEPVEGQEVSNQVIQQVGLVSSERPDSKIRELTDSQEATGGDIVLGFAVSTNAMTLESVIIRHQGSLKRIPASSRNGEHVATSRWPMYTINVMNGKESYPMIFDRQQYEFCYRLFAVLDTENDSSLELECIRHFVDKYCPVTSRRDNAVSSVTSTVDEIWSATLSCDAGGNHHITNGIERIGLEGWLVFCRLLALTQHLESQRRFASRHLQELFRHKHGVASKNSNEVLVVVDNPPPGPPEPITIEVLTRVERERSGETNEQILNDWPYNPLPGPELDLKCIARGKPIEASVRVEPFASQREDFILRYHVHESGKKTVVRRSYLDFQWLDDVMNQGKRPGQGQICGYILPPLSSKNIIPAAKSTQYSPEGYNRQHNQDIGERALSAAQKGINLISSMAKSLSGYMSAETNPVSFSTSQPFVLSDRTADGPTPPAWSGTALTAQRIERYLNYLLANASLSKSFALHAMLSCSHSGLESAKLILADIDKQRKLKQKAPCCTENSATAIFSALVSRTLGSHREDTPWLRAAAQVALRLEFHNVLETTGYEAASSKVQHASLPRFGSTRPSGSWDESDLQHSNDSKAGDSPDSASFESGVVNIRSELGEETRDDGFDLLPSPGPSEIHRVLGAGGTDSSAKADSIKRYAYEASRDDLASHIDENARVGSLRIEQDVDKLRIIVKSIDRTLGKLHTSSARIQAAQKSRGALLLNMLKDVSSLGDGDVLNQRSLVKGVASLQRTVSEAERANCEMTEDLLWQSALANSAISATTEVRDAVRVSFVASRAKSAAFAAAEKAKKTYESCESTSRESAQRKQQEASATQMQAIHATVLDFEANAAKRRSAIALAKDMKNWNAHRKLDLLNSCVKVATEQREACRKSAADWDLLQNGLVDAPDLGIVESNEIKLWSTSNDGVQRPFHSPFDDENNAGESAQSLHNLPSVRSPLVTTSIENPIDAITGSMSLGSETSESEVYCFPNTSCLPNEVNENYLAVRHLNSSDDSNSVATDGTSHLNEVSSGELMSTSMQSLIDGLMNWGEEQKNAHQLELFE